MADKKTFYGIQVLRGCAALLVVAFHTIGGLRGGVDQGMAPATGYTSMKVPFFGNGGVDLFFLISGFVIVWTTQDSWRRDHAWRGFMEKRVTRIFPLYWALTTLKLLTVVAAASLFRGSALAPWNVVASYLLIPSWDPEGHIQPLISAGWTLAYEMFFYYVCAVCLALKRRPVVAITPVFLVLGVIGMFRTPAWGAIASLIDPLLLEFVAGMWIAEATRQGRVTGAAVPMVALLAIAVAGLCASDLLPIPVEYDYRVLVWGVPAAAILYAVIALEPRFDFRRLWLPLLIGDASYSIYLGHAIVLNPLVGLARRWTLSPLGEWAVVAVVVAVATAIGIAVWWVLERKIIGGLLHLSKPMRQAWVNPQAPALR